MPQFICFGGFVTYRFDQGPCLSNERYEGKGHMLVSFDNHGRWVCGCQDLSHALYIEGKDNERYEINRLLFTLPSIHLSLPSSWE